MLYHLSQILENWYHGFSLLQYITLRTILAALSSLLLTIGIGPFLIKKLSNLQIGQVVRDDGPQSHLVKSGTPTMGGILIILSILVTTLLWANLNNTYIWLVLFVMIGAGAIGWFDDYKKLVLKNTDGLSARVKMLGQSIVALIVMIVLYTKAETRADLSLYFPFFKNVSLYLGPLFIVLGYMVIVGTSNAVNLTDGLDGLAILPVAMVATALGIFAYISGHVQFSEYLALPHISGTGELVVFCGAVVGASLGFLWFNTYPAQVFMGDVGALSLGAVLGTVAIIVKQELTLFIMGGIFVAETVSVILQVGSYKLRGKRIFKMAPLHHHFELSGWPEPRVIVRFWIITFILVLVGLSTLKIR